MKNYWKSNDIFHVFLNILAPVVSSEPKTYANLVKSGSYNQTAQHQTPQVKNI